MHHKSCNQYFTTDWTLQFIKNLTEIHSATDFWSVYMYTDGEALLLWRHAQLKHESVLHSRECMLKTKLYTTRTGLLQCTLWNRNDQYPCYTCKSNYFSPLLHLNSSHLTHLKRRLTCSAHVAGAAARYHGLSRGTTFASIILVLRSSVIASKLLCLSGACLIR